MRFQSRRDVGNLKRSEKNNSSMLDHSLESELTYLFRTVISDIVMI